jgi:single-stranded DNA-binding protein
VNVVMLVGEVCDRPFRPGSGSRTVVQLRTRGGGAGKTDQFEFDAFGQPGEFGLRLFVGDQIAVTGHLEDRTYQDGGETVTELRVVADFIELVTRAGDRTNRPPREHRDDDRPRDRDDRPPHDD